MKVLRVVEDAGAGTAGSALLSCAAAGAVMLAAMTSQMAAALR
jgi:hypothetical protein